MGFGCVCVGGFINRSALRAVPILAMPEEEGGGSSCSPESPNSFRRLCWQTARAETLELGPWEQVSLFARCQPPPGHRDTCPRVARLHGRAHNCICLGSTLQYKVRGGSGVCGQHERSLSGLPGKVMAESGDGCGETLWIRRGRESSRICSRRLFQQGDCGTLVGAPGEDPIGDF